MTEPTAPPKRDKFASMAAAAAAATSPAPPGTTVKRDKFASMAAQQEQPKQSTTTASNDDDVSRNALVQERMKQRDTVLQDLQQAEAWTWNLLNLASQTAHSLSNISQETNQEKVSLYSKQYRETLEKLHGILTPHASLVVAYENHSIDQTKEKKKQDNNMYAARVEMRLAQERRNVLQELLRLEQAEGGTSSNSAEQETAAAAAGEKRKRKE